MRSPALLLALSALLAGCAAPSASEAPDGTTSASARLEPEAFLLLPIEEAGPFRLRATLSAAAPFDAWILHGDACRLSFSIPAHDPTDAMSAQSAGTLERDVPVGNACVILENAGDEFGGATPTGEVVVDYTIDVWR